MNRILALLTLGLALSPHWQMQGDSVESCIASCRAPRPNVDMQREEIINLERETVRAIQLKNTSFFSRVYSDDYSGALSHGQSVNKAQFIDVVRGSAINYESFIVSNIQVRFYRDTAVAICLWSARSVIGSQRVGAQLRVTHVYINSASGWKVIASQATPLPPDGNLPI
jgi:ketosteroid isomerase-like protein